MNLTLSSLDRFGDIALAAVRVMTGAVLVNQTWANVPEAERLVSWVRPIGDLALPSSALFDQLPTLVQFVAGVLLLLGLLTRWAGLLLAGIVAVALIRVGLVDPFGTDWPRLVLFFLGLLLATAGPGRYALDNLFAGKGKRR